ncbi:phosphoglycerate mutase family protein [Kangiella sediminilitoris]|uniref:Phosphoglycerate mutase n=1 Tax=Kangiella sediminilitoris TaxID=1144748 RepID=A0A1B3BAH0_9GAMM|nr:phosphoglycerate mutase family protein [Kangiella sediminilitoris]AOE49791.1 hypothetical protein KS2013_1071 [Kangiella sediminilitoris]
MTLIFRVVVLFAFLTFSLGSVAAEDSLRCTDYDVFVVRHFEKQMTEQQDPELSELGMKQARKFSQLEPIKNVKHGFYTPFKRAKQSLQFLDAETSEYSPGELSQLVTKVKRDFCGESVVVVGHSNTVPQIIKAFGGKFSVSYAGVALSKEPKITLNESDYGDVFRITYHNERVHQQLYQIKIMKSEE